MQPYLITYNEAFELTRKMSVHIDKDKIDSFIREAENMDLKPVLGDKLLYAVKNNPSEFAVLLNGGMYKTTSGDVHTFEGLKSALAYFTFARFVRNGDGNVTRSGFTLKDNEHSVRASEAEKERTYNDTKAIADRYLSECMDFVRVDAKCRDCCGKENRKNGRYKVLGD